MSHPFGDLISQHLHRKHGLSQSKLAAGILQAPTVVTAMCKGKRLTGPQARERVLAIIGWLHQQGALATLDEANALLNAAGMASLNFGSSAEAALVQSLRPSPDRHVSTAPRIAHHHNLPAPTTPLIGREADISVARKFLHRGDVRLITLLGPPGVGKTRLAIEVAREASNDPSSSRRSSLDDSGQVFADGVWFVPLASINDPDLVASTIAQALGISSPELKPSEHVKQYLRDKRMLLVLDNVEQLLRDSRRMNEGRRLAAATAATFVAGILAAAPDVKVLITSRAALRINGEHSVEVAPLAAPAAIELFVQRAQAIKPTFALTEGNAQTIADLCQRLDRLPLAIELAAAHTNVLPVETILKRLDQRFPLLRRGARDAPDRHQTLQNAIDWGYNLLSDAERSLFRQLSIFVGGFTLEALEALWPATEDAGDVVDIVASLVDKSLVQRMEQDASRLRFTQLETIREYGLLKLTETTEIKSARRNHARHFLALAEAAEPMLYGSEQVAWLEHLGEEHDNLRAALQWSIQADEATIAARLGIALWHFWYIRSHHQEGTQWLERILGMPVSKEERAKLLYGLGMLARRAGGDAVIYAHLTESLELFREVEDAYGIASALRVLGFMDYRRGRLAPAQQKLSEALALFRELDHSEGTAVTLANLAYVHQVKLDWSAARTYQEESLGIRRKTGNRHGMATSLDSLGLIAIHQKDIGSAKCFLLESIGLYEELGNRESTAAPIDLLGAIAYLEGKFDEACVHYEQAYAYAKQRANKEHMAAIEIDLALAMLCVDRDNGAFAFLHRALTYLRTTDNPEHLEHITRALAVFCLAAFKKGYLAPGLRAAGRCEHIKAKAARNVLASSIFHDLELAVMAARKTLGSQDADTAWAEGEAMTLDMVIARALEVCSKLP